MREGWKETRLGDLIDPKRPITYGVVQPGDHDPDGVPLVRGGDFSFGWKPIGAYRRVSKDIEGSFSRARLKTGDLVLTIKGDVGTAAIVPSFLEGANISQTNARVAIDPNRALAEIVLAFLESHEGRSQIAAVTQVGAQPGLIFRDIKGFRLLLPPLSEQRRIAAILRTWDEALEKLNALRALNIRRRIWLRTHLFTSKVRLSGFTGEWRTVPLSAVLHEHGSKSTGAEDVYSVSVHKGLVNQVEHLGRSFSAASTDHYNRVLPGDIVYTKSPTGDFPLGIIKQSKIDREVIVSPLYGVFTPQTYALGVILDALFESPLAARNYLHPLVQKGAKNTIAVTNKQFLEGKLHLPMDPDEQAAIADVVNTSHAELACLDAEIKALTDQKRGLMQKLLTGEWRVEVSNEEEAAA